MYENNLLLYCSFKEYIAFSRDSLLVSLFLRKGTNMHGIISGSFLLLRLNIMVQDITGLHLNLDMPKWLSVLHLDQLKSYASNELLIACQPLFTLKSFSCEWMC